MPDNFFVNVPPITGGSGSGVLSINGDTTAAQTIAGGNAISAGTVGGVTTVAFTGSTTVDLLFPANSNIGVQAGQHSGTDYRPANMFLTGGIFTGNILNLDPPYGFNNAIVDGYFAAGNNLANTAVFLGASTLFNGVAQATYGFLKDGGVSTVPAFVNLNTAGDYNMYYGLSHRSIARQDFLKFGADGSFSVLAGDTNLTGNLNFPVDQTYNIGTPDGGTTLDRPSQVYIANLLDLDSAGTSSSQAPTINLGLSQLIFDYNTDATTISAGSNTVGDGAGYLELVGNLVNAQCTIGTDYSVLTPGLYSSALYLGTPGGPGTTIVAGGVVVPKLTTTQRLAMQSAIALPAGLIVLDTTLHKMCFYDDTGTWQVITSV